MIQDCGRSAVTLVNALGPWVFGQRNPQAQFNRPGAALISAAVSQGWKYKQWKAQDMESQDGGHARPEGPEGRAAPCTYVRRIQGRKGPRGAQHLGCIKNILLHNGGGDSEIILVGLARPQK